MNDPMVYLEIPFEGTRSKGVYHYPLDTSGQRGRTLLWACPDEASAIRFAEILAGNLDASPGCKTFGIGAEPPPPMPRLLDAPLDVRICRECGARPAARHRTLCAACGKAAERRRRIGRAAEARVEAMAWRLFA